jgi:hypothetical protein
MKALFAVLILLVVSCPAAQQHAPTADVCRADVALWYSALLSTEYHRAQTDWITDQIPNRTAIEQNCRYQKCLCDSKKWEIVGR